MGPIPPCYPSIETSRTRATDSTHGEEGPLQLLAVELLVVLGIEAKLPLGIEFLSEIEQDRAGLKYAETVVQYGRDTSIRVDLQEPGRLDLVVDLAYISIADGELDDFVIGEDRVVGISCLELLEEGGDGVSVGSGGGVESEFIGHSAGGGVETIAECWIAKEDPWRLYLSMQTPDDKDWSFSRKAAARNRL